MSDKERYLCNNCGLYGHLFYNCRKPITSFGVVCFRTTPSGINEYLMVQRKDSLGYVDFLRGKYNPNNEFNLINIIKEMTIDEIENIKNNSYSYLWNKLWNKKNEKYDKRNEEKFNIVKTTKGHLFDKYNMGWKEPEWGFPKGRRNFKEKDYDCAFREFQEETGYEMRNLRIIKNVYPFEEIFTGSNLKSYKHRYFLCSIDMKHTMNTSNFQKSEIGNLKWFDISNVKKEIRSYNDEKIKLIDNVHFLLTENRLT
jgi:8-oxo-dGTP pyrophosphatase MutT (NUDIX family)